MSISIKPFGHLPCGCEAKLYTMTNKSGASVSVTNYGGILVSIIVPDKTGKMGDVLLGYDSIEVDNQVAKISLVGAGMLTHVGVAADMFEALYDAGINIEMIATSEIRISVLVSKDDANRALKVVHDKFFGDED